MDKFTHKTSCHGFSLIEVLVALLILAASMIGLTRFQSDMIQSNDLAKQRTEATILAQNKLEFFRGQIFQSHSSQNIGSGSDQIESQNTTYTREWNSNAIVDGDNGTNGDIELKMTIHWPDLRKKSETGEIIASDRTTVYLSSILSQQPFSNSAFGLKQHKSKHVKLMGMPSKHDE